MTKQQIREEGFILLIFHISVHCQKESEQELKQGGNLEAGAKAEAVEEWCLLACFPLIVQPAFL